MIVLRGTLGCTPTVSCVAVASLEIMERGDVEQTATDKITSLTSRYIDFVDRQYPCLILVKRSETGVIGKNWPVSSHPQDCR